jgi:hypothetical protein
MDFVQYMNNLFKDKDASEFNSHYPKSSLGYKTNNKYPIFPPLMADGRSVISSWDTEATLNAQIRKQNGIMNNWDYRQYLTKNANKIMEYNYNETANDTGHVFVPDSKSGSNSPFLYGSIYEKPASVDFNNGDLKEMYLTREQLYSRKCAPSIKESELKV